ncbi:MAG: hypothetical protein QOF60_1086 [Actinomycetota bacterium]|jgi:diguanylate cyclase (GGDEF)-like protein/PAS domain S-box-containing protein|nr:hypothetical protein [Actinomycetota bacterium]
MKLPLPAKAVIAMAALIGAAVAHRAGELAALQGFGPIAYVVVLGALAAATWVWPLLIYRGAESEAVHLDEGFFVIMALLLPPAGTILAFAGATVVAQLVRRRPMVKSIFNFGQVLASVGMGIAAFDVVSPSGAPLTPRSLVAACIGALVFFLVNSCSLGLILTATGAMPFRKAIFDGVQIRLVLVAACVGTAVIAALALSAYTWAIALVGLPFLILRQVLAGHFRARHDRARMQGLFEATLDVNRSMGSLDVEGSLCQWANVLLRSQHASVVHDKPEDGGLAAPLGGSETPTWMVVSGRSKAEPFDSADHALLEALAAVGTGALANAALYGEVRRHQDHLATITSTLGEGVCAVDTNRRITFVNPAAQQMLGLDPAEAASITAGEPSKVRLDFLDGPVGVAMTSRTTVRVEDTTFRRLDGEPLAVAFTCSPIVQDGVATGAVLVFRDIAERKAFEERLAHHAFHDALTGLPNRRVFLDRLENALGRARRSDQTHAVLFADVDRFKVVNDGVGHLGGDHLLIAIAERLSAAVRPGDTVARFGGDEFTVLLEDIGGPEEVARAAARLLATLDEPILLPSGHEVVATLSMGVAMTSADQISADDVLHNADVAMYQAKAKGLGRYELFDPSAMGARSIERIELEVALRHALENDEIEVHYQPVFTTESKSIVGTEALVRWRHPRKGLVSPGDFIGLAEETGLILSLGKLVLESACRQTKAWTDEFGRPLTVAVNLSARQFGQPDLSVQVSDVLAATGLAPSALCLEITESVAVQDMERTIGMLHELKRLGVRLAIDDFGTGYSSLNYLKQFPVDVVKLDRGFVAGLETSTVDAAIIAAVVGLSSAIGISIVAEGVETQSQFDTLAGLGCEFVQGYLLAKPEPADDFRDRLAASRAPSLVMLAG